MRYIYIYICIYIYKYICILTVVLAVEGITVRCLGLQIRMYISISFPCLDCKAQSSGFWKSPTMKPCLGTRKMELCCHKTRSGNLPMPLPSMPSLHGPLDNIDLLYSIATMWLYRFDKCTDFKYMVDLKYLQLGHFVIM